MEPALNHAVGGGPFALFAALGPWDAVAAGLFLTVVSGLTLLIERQSARRPSVGWLMARRRERWMAEMAERDVRIVDSALLAIQHQGAGFFASACLIAIGGVAALIGSAETVKSVADDLAPAVAPRAVWELKLLVLAGVLVLALLSFIWAQRLFGYCAIMIGATPPPGGDNDRREVAATAALLNIRAGRSFNRGLRLVYFALATLAWLIGPLAFMLATLAAGAMIYRREFLSVTHAALSQAGPGADRDGDADAPGPGSPR